jgi:hypothetical protein
MAKTASFTYRIYLVLFAALIVQLSSDGFAAAAPRHFAMMGLPASVLSQPPITTIACSPAKRRDCEARYALCKREFPPNQQAVCSRNHAICLTACE